MAWLDPTLCGNILPLLRRFFLHQAPVEILRLALGDADPLPVAVVADARQQNDLSDVIGDVGDRPRQRFVDRVILPANGDDLRQVVIAQLGERRFQNLPAFLPYLFRLLVAVLPFGKFGIPVAPTLFAVAGQKIGEARDQVAADVADDDGYGIVIGAEHFIEQLIRDLGERFLPDDPVAFKFSSEIIHHNDEEYNEPAAVAKGNPNQQKCGTTSWA